MLYIFSLSDGISISADSISAGNNAGGFRFGTPSRFVALERDATGSLEVVLNFNGSVRSPAEQTTSFVSVSRFSDITDFVSGAFDALIGDAEEFEEMIQLMGPDRASTLAANPAFANLRTYEVNLSSNQITQITLPSESQNSGGTTGDDTLDGTASDNVINGLDGNDTLNGMDGNDDLNGGPGNDLIYGGSGTDEVAGGAGSDVLIADTASDRQGTGDIAVFSGNADAYTVRGGSTYAVVTGANGERDKLFGFQFLRFDDGTVELSAGSALDGAGDPADFVVAERVALLYEAALNRDGNIDLPGLNFYIGVTERDGLSDEFLAQDLMTSPEFTASFGDANTLSNADFLEQIYLNVLDRASDAAGRQFYLDLLNEGTITKALALADIAVSPENTTESTAVLMGLYESAENEWAFL